MMTREKGVSSGLEQRSEASEVVLERKYSFFLI
jgi:hypothetical protein